MGWREVMAGPGAVEQAEPGSRKGNAVSPQVGESARRRSEPGPRPAGKANRLAVTALICAAAIPFLLVAGILGAVFGFVALDEIEESEGAERGRGIAYGAIALGFVNIALSIAVIAWLITLLAQ